MFQLSRIIPSTSKCCNVLPSLLRFNNFALSPPFTELKNSQDAEDISLKPRGKLNSVIGSPSNHSAMVAEVFASLNSEENTLRTPYTDARLEKAKNIDELLSVSQGNGVSTRHALKVVSILADWTNAGKVELADFERDSRFIRLCKLLTKSGGSHKPSKIIMSRSDDLTTVLSVTADDEAAKMVENITLSQMVKVMQTLSLRKRRSILLLRALAYNITGSTDQLNLKQCSDLLYSMATLNFPDENLLSRVGGDICIALEKNIKKGSVVGSILTSLGLMKYKNPGLLDSLSEWMVKNDSSCRPQDIFSLLMTLAVLNYFPTNSERLFEVLLPQLTPSEATSPVVWLEIVWSLVLLNKASNEQVSSVLSEEFLKKLSEDSSSTSIKLKLLNIDSAAQYLQKDYKGPRISENSPIRITQISHTKEKYQMVNSVLDTLKNLIQSEKLIRTKVNTGLGFFIDAECLLDKKCSPVPLEQVKLNKEARRVAILTYDYHDMTRGRVEPTGINVFATNILRSQGFRIVTVPYVEYRPSDKLVQRVQYLESKLKEIVK
ncbi:FAST kinase domain-containing protein 4 isoform X1 [Leptinotarsa decemlineata]|uniref:FAST kinase domain-containing protein 4 isoform X1 n=1 Tax=Leptinotarsa decemlineata TaxID=7539 RepID=UPI003D30B26A